jgi:peptide/nickel transport system permease protein
MQRLFNGLIVVFFISLFTFLVIYWIPGDPAAIALGTEASPAQLTLMREEMGLNDPFIVQYFNWLFQALTGDLGNSFSFGEEVTTLITQRLPVTFALTTLSLLISVPLGFMIGTLSALYKDSWLDGLSRTFMQLGNATPGFWLGLIAIYYISFQLGWFPIAGYVPLSEGLWASIYSLLLPAIIMSIGQVGSIIRITRSSVLSALQEEFMLNTQMNALTKSKTLFKYVFRYAATGPITVIGNTAAALFGGTILIEEIFALPGIGRLLMHSVTQRDLILLQGVVIFITTMVVVINLLTDLIVDAVNPVRRSA